MFRKLTLAVPLIAATTFAQEVVTDNWTAEAYGEDLIGSDQMLMKCFVTEDERLLISNGEAGQPVVIVASLNRAQIDLSALGLKGWLLVDNPVVIGGDVLDASGMIAAPMDHITGAGYAFQTIFTQAVSIANEAPSFSNGLRFEFHAQTQKSTQVEGSSAQFKTTQDDPADQRRKRAGDDLGKEQAPREEEEEEGGSGEGSRPVFKTTQDNPDDQRRKQNPGGHSKYEPRNEEESGGDESSDPTHKTGPDSNPKLKQQQSGK